MNLEKRILKIDSGRSCGVAKELRRARPKQERWEVYSEELHGQEDRLRQSSLGIAS